MPPDDHAPILSRRGIRIAAIAGGAVAVLIVITGVVAREADADRLREWTEMQALPTVAVAPPDAHGQARYAGFAGAA